MDHNQRLYALRHLEERDLSKVLQWRNSDRVRPHMFHDHFVSQKEHEQWFSSLDKNKDLFFIFEYQQSPVGVVYFKMESLRNPFGMRKGRGLGTLCYWGFYLGEANVPKGTGTYMGVSGLDLAFEHLGIRKLYAEVIALNERSIRFHQRLGFKEEGVLKQHHLKNNQYVDVISYAIFKDQWEGHKRTLGSEG
ncbi:UDP-4-amino-4,6-dideoxy-N-acetyl-beta-L-altrosamine N-acetyltransferase [Halobacillus sp. Marseille-Q1614]|uniref:UDP-4-amino-4, 6-dideoxy-N-acetyl-beta-L-altrosamine N-acetyltransferase n=1 Tax=Halobacillus sp. Marseille-Q1614 TaxID=2709134 RepID=UPI00156F77E2|nr:UDP-4-amino-4,6-dideoxy-N-acetyl-beta-L-altrosamine N-acetyltransferase [Halobacillus sp. Marseille-Q1614]